MATASGMELEHSSKSRFSQLGNFPGSIAGGIYFIIFVVAHMTGVIPLEVMTLLILAPIGLLIYYEIQQNNRANNNLGSTRMFSVISRYNILFIAGGLILGFVWSLIAMFFDQIVGIYQNAGRYPFLLVFMYNIAIMLAALLALNAFYNIQQEDTFSGQRFRLFSDGVQINVLMTYFLAFFTFPLIGLVIAFNLRYDLTLEYNRNFENSLILASTEGAIIFILMTMFTYLGYFYVLGNDMQYFMWKTRLRIPQKDHLRRVALKIGSSFMVSLLFLLALFNADTKLPFLLFYAILVLSIGARSITQIPKQPTYCAECNSMISEKNGCRSCETAVTEFGVPQPLREKVPRPECPACAKAWTEMSRRCNQCGYTIILSCPHCYQTINPLWKTCSNCKNPLKTIPELALFRGDSPQYASALTNLRLLLVFLVIYGTFDGFYTFVLFEYANTTNSDFAIRAFDNFARVIVYVSVILSILFLNFNYAKEHFKPIILLVTKLIFLPFLLFSFFIVNIFMVETLKILFLPNDISTKLLYVGFFAILSYTFYRSQYQSILNFRPTIKFDPILFNRVVAIDNEVKRE